MITPRENLLRVLRHEQPAWVPVSGHCDPYNQPNQEGMDPALKAQLANVQWGDESTVNFSRFLHLDITDFYGAPITARQRKVEVEWQRDGDYLTGCWHTSQGDMTQVQRFSPDTGMWYTEKHQVETAEDIAKLAEVFADEEWSLDPDREEQLRQRCALVGDDGLVMFALPGTPLGQMIRVHAGVMHTAFLWADARAEMEALFAVMTDNHLRQFSLAAQAPGGDILLGMDDTSTTALSPAMFEATCMDYTDRIADAVHAGGKYYFHHSCGLIRDLLALYRQTKMDGVHGYTIQPMGDVSIADGMDALGDRIVIFAALVQLFGSMADLDAVTESVRAMFEEAPSGRNLILGLAADPEKTMVDTTYILDICRMYQRLA